MSLHDLFDELRRTEEALVPPFRIALRPRNRYPFMRALATAALVILIIASLMLPLRRRQAPVAQFKAPTDFLLDTPQSKFMRTVPTFAVIPRRGTS